MLPEIPVAKGPGFSGESPTTGFASFAVNVCPAQYVPLNPAAATHSKQVIHLHCPLNLFSCIFILVIFNVFTSLPSGNAPTITAIIGTLPAAATMGRIAREAAREQEGFIATMLVFEATCLRPQSKAWQSRFK